MNDLFVIIILLVCLVLMLIMGFLFFASIFDVILWTIH